MRPQRPGPRSASGVLLDPVEGADGRGETHHPTAEHSSSVREYGHSARTATNQCNHELTFEAHQDKDTCDLRWKPSQQRVMPTAPVREIHVIEGTSCDLCIEHAHYST